MLLIVEDAFEDADGELRPAGHQILRVRAKTWKLSRLSDGCEVEAVCRFHKGRLVLDRFESVVDRDDPLPDVRLPERKVAINDADGHLPDINEVDKAARAGGWGTLAHSVYKMNIPVHVVYAVKGRSQCLLGSETLAQMVLRQVIEAEPGDVEVIAVAVENHSGGHVHLVLRHSKPGGTPPTWSWPRFIGRIKALASRRIAALPGVVDFPGFQDGYSICSVGGGRNGAETALEVVRQYVINQGVQGEAAGP